MVDSISVPTFEQIETILSKLATNYSSMALVFYDVFYNTEPMDVTFQMYNEAGVLQTYTIPNRAKDRDYILNGNNSPEGVVAASAGSIYQDLTNGDLYIKKTPEDNTGWDIVITGQSLGNFIIQGFDSPEGTQIAAKGILYIDKNSADLYIKTTTSGNTGWTLISANTSSLANSSLSNLTQIGENHFANPSLSNLDASGEAVLNAKEDVSNKVVTINSSSTDSEFPSAKATYTFVNSQTSDCADKDLNNLNDLGNQKFLNMYSQIRDCIISAPRGVLSRNGNQLTFPGTTIVFGANGKEEDGSFKNKRIVLDSDKNAVIPLTGWANKEGVIFYDNTYNVLRYVETSRFYVTSQSPAIMDFTDIWYNPVSNIYYIAASGDWQTAIMTEIGRFITNSSSSISSFFPYSPVQAVTQQARVVVSSWIDPATNQWFRVYNDGWCEQGGLRTGSGSVSLKKEYTSDKYVAMATPSTGTVSLTKTTNTLAITASSGSAEVNWLTYGFINI